MCVAVYLTVLVSRFILHARRFQLWRLGRGGRVAGWRMAVAVGQRHRVGVV